MFMQLVQSVGGVISYCAEIFFTFWHSLGAMSYFIGGFVVLLAITKLLLPIINSGSMNLDRKAKSDSK